MLWSQFLHLFSWVSGGIGLKFQSAFLWRLIMICSLSCAICIFACLILWCVCSSLFPLFLLVCLYIITLQESTRLLISLLLVMCVTNISIIVCTTIFFTQGVSSLYNSLWEFNFIFIRSNLSFCCCFHCICFWSSVSSLKNICLPHGSKDLSLHFCKQLYFLKIDLFIHLAVAAHGIFDLCWGMWDLVSSTRDPIWAPFIGSMEF